MAVLSWPLHSHPTSQVAFSLPTDVVLCPSDFCFDSITQRTSRHIQDRCAKLFWGDLIARTAVITEDKIYAKIVPTVRDPAP